MTKLNDISKTETSAFEKNAEAIKKNVDDKEAENATLDKNNLRIAYDAQSTAEKPSKN